VVIPHVYNGKDKLFFFASFLQLSHNSSSTFQSTVPTLLERQGDFSQSYIADASGKPALVTIYNPFTATPIAGISNQYQRQPYAGNIVSNPNPYGLKILQAFPVPNYAPLAGTDARLGLSQACAVGNAAICGGGGPDLFHTNNYQFLGNIPEARNSVPGRVDFAEQQPVHHFTFGMSGHRTNPNQWGSNATDPGSGSPTWAISSIRTRTAYRFTLSSA
jgi:hypothetical protein